MRGLASLIRLHRWKLDEQRKTLANLERLAGEMRGQIGQIGENLRSEAELADQSIEATRAFSAYMTAEMERRDRLESSLAELNHQVAESREMVAAAFRQLKAYEITLHNRESHKASRRRRREQTALNEVGLNIYRMKNSGGGTV